MTDLPTTDAYQKALARIQEFTGCLEDSPEEQELIELTEGVKVFEDAVRNLVAKLRIPP